MYIILLLITLLQKPFLVNKEYIISETQNGFCIISNDSLYRWTPHKGWNNSRLKAKDFSIKEKLSIYTDGRNLFYSAGIGLVYELKGDSIIRLDNSFDWKSRYGSKNIYYNKRLYSFGGYGLMTYKNNLVFWDERIGEWMLQEYANETNVPERILNGIVSNKDSLAYFIKPKEVNESHSYSIVPRKNRKVHQFNFNSRKWSILGELEEGFNLFSRANLTHLDNHFIYDNLGNLGEIIFDKNELRIYSSHDKGLFKDSRNIIGNPRINKFLLMIENEKNKMETPFVFSKSVLIGDEYLVQQLYSPANGFIRYVAFLSLLIAIGIIIYFLFRKKNIIKIIHKNHHSIENKLTQDEKIILKLIIDQNPSSIEIATILSSFAPQLTYESRVKKFRKSIKNIEAIIQEKTNLSETIFVFQKNKEDRRIREIKIKTFK